LEIKINLLENELAEKNEQILKKDLVPNEQLNVINDLANKIMNAIFEPLQSLFSKF